MNQTNPFHFARNVLKTLDCELLSAEADRDPKHNSNTIDLSDYAGYFLVGLAYRLWGIWAAEQAGGPAEKWINLLTSSNRPTSKSWRIYRDLWRNEFLKGAHTGVPLARVIAIREEVRGELEDAMSRDDEAKEWMYRFAN